MVFKPNMLLIVFLAPIEAEILGFAPMFKGTKQDCSGKRE